jgi:hypothetical protein
MSRFQKTQAMSKFNNGVQTLLGELISALYPATADSECTCSYVQPQIIKRRIADPSCPMHAEWRGEQ